MPRQDALKMKEDKLRSVLLNQDRPVYLAACSHSPVTRGLVDSMEKYREDLLEFGNPWDLWMKMVDDAVHLFAKIIHASPAEVFPSFSVSSALSSVMSSLDYRKRSGLVVSDLEYPTTNFIFLAQKKYGARIATLRSRRYSLSPEAYRRAINDRTLLTSAIHVSSINGFRQDVNEICRIAHESGSLFYTDTYQSLGTMPVDVRKSDFDFMASGNLKFLLGLPGIAFMYVRRDLVERLEPASIGWFSQRDPFLFGARKLDFQSTAARFQSGTLSIPSVYAALAGMRTIIDVGVRDVEKRISTLTEHALRLSEELRLRTISPEEPEKRGAIVSFVVRRPHALENRLREEGIVTSSRGEGIRIAPHFYNTAEEIDEAVGMISRLRDF